jgi:tRNA U38,U39,U40 pseudouridine synthase TruA
VLEEAARRLTAEPGLRAVLSSRTDKGVHANGMVALLRTASGLEPSDYRRRCTEVTAAVSVITVSWKACAEPDRTATPTTQPWHPPPTAYYL